MNERISLLDGTSIPAVGLGTLRMGAQETQETISAALAAGYRLIDTAACYGNERAIGAAVRSAAIPREDLYITTKVWNTDHGYQEAIDAFDASRERLGLDRVDLYLIHWPVAPMERVLQTWSALIELRERGEVGSIGVSNFMPAHLDALIAEFDVLPVLNQVECHPLFAQYALEEYQRAHGIRTQAWAPLGKAGALDHPTLGAIAQRHAVTSAQVVLRWHLQRGRLVIPKSTNPQRIAANIDLDFTLSETDLAAVDALDEGKRLGSHPDAPPTNPLPEQL